MTIQDHFQVAAQQLCQIYDENEARNILRIYFADALGITNFHKKTRLEDAQITMLNQAVERMRQHEPVQYILGEADFFGYKFKVSPAVLIPRPETEELVDLMISDHKKHVPHTDDFQLLDIGTGSGCIPITLKKKLPKANVHAVDVSDVALKIATQNAEQLAVKIDFSNLDILNKNQWTRFADQSLSVVVSNPPYIPFSEQNLMAKNVLDYEPELALFVENEEPLIFYSTIAQFAQQKLKNGGFLYFECNEYNARTVHKTLMDLNFQEVEIILDMSGKERMIRAKFVSIEA
ncbi:MAG: peptide chain release factor N(5)-glutamine methyltransferase [Saprospiraceae bacterium]